MQETVNQRIFHIRKLKGYTQADMARTLRVEQIIRTRLKVVYFGAFYPIQSCKALALLRLTRIKIPQNLLTLRSKILKSEDFYSDEAQNAVNPDGLTSILTKYEWKSAFLKRSSDYSLYPNMRLSTYSQAERKGKIKTDFLIKIAEILEVDVGYLLTGKENKVCDSEITVPAVITTEPTTAPKFEEKEDLAHLLSRISLTDGILTALLNISSDRRKAIYKLIILTVKHRIFDIISEVERIEALLETKKDLWRIKSVISLFAIKTEKI